MLSFIVLIGLLVAGSFHQMGGYGVETDFYWAYAPDAQRIVHGEMPQEPGVGPLYPLTLGVLNLVIGDIFVAGKTLSVLSTILCGLFTFGFVRSLFNARLAFFTLVLWFATVLPWALVASTDMFFSMLVAASIASLYHKGVISRRNIVFSGIFMGLTYLTRHNAVVLPIGVVLILILLNPESWSLSLRLRSLAIFAGVFVLVNLPWSIIQALAGGDAVRSDSYLIIASHFYGRPGVVSSEDMRLAAKQFDSLWSVVTYDFAHFVKHYLSNIYRHFNDFLTTSVKFPAFLFVAAGALTLFPKINKRQLSLFFFPALSFLLLCLVHYEPRYYLYILSFFVLLVPFFLFESFKEEMLSEPGKRLSKALRGVVFAVTACFLLFFSVKEVKQNIAQEPRELLKAAAALHGKVDPRGTIIARKPHLGFLSKLQTIYFPEAKSVQELLAFAAAKRADYLLYGEIERDRRPELQELLDPGNELERMTPIFVLDNPKTIVYKLNYSTAEEGSDGGIGS